MRIAPVNSEVLAKKRAIVASFAAGVGAMFVLGLVAPISHGLSLTSAEAHSLPQRAALIQPVDVVTIEATLADAERSMAASRRTTDAAMARLERLAR